MDKYERKIRYLESIQRIIDRLSNMSFILKGWAITIGAGVSVLSSNVSNLFLALILCCPTLVFWILDSEYLRMERQYRILYNTNADFKDALNNFKMMRPKANRNDKTLLWQSIMSRTELWFYLPIFVITSAIVFIQYFS